MFSVTKTKVLVDVVMTVFGTCTLDVVTELTGPNVDTVTRTIPLIVIVRTVGPVPGSVTNATFKYSLALAHHILGRFHTI